MTWLTTALALLKLIGTLVELARETKAANETRAAALGRIILDAQATVAKARVARTAADQRNADPVELRKSDGFERAD